MEKKVDWRGIGWFVGLTFLITWAAEFYFIFARGSYFAGLLPVPEQILLTAVMFVPAVVTVVVTKLITKEGLGVTGLKLGPWRGYLEILVIVVGVFAGAFLLTWILGLSQPDWELKSYRQLLAQLAPGAAEQFNPLVFLTTLFLATLTVNPLFSSIATFGEELGWRGYLLPKLMPLGKVRAVVISGVIWGLWHAPLIVRGFNYPGYPVLGVLLMILFTTFCGALLGAYRLKYNSVFLATWAHAVINTQGRGIWYVIFSQVNPVLGGAIGLTGLIFWLAVAVWALRWMPEQQLAQGDKSLEP